MGLLLLWWKSGRVAETVDSGTQTLEEGRSDHEARQGRALQQRLPVLFETTLQKRALGGGAFGFENKF